MVVADRRNRVTVRAYAPGRVNLIGDHTDYSGGYALPMAIDRGTTVVFEPGGATVELTSADETEPAVVSIDVADPGAITPGWARYVAGVVAATRPVHGGRGTITSDLPIGVGLSSSASLEVALALALGFTGPALELALACQRAEHLAWGTPTGILDQLASVAGRAGHALLIDCTSLAVVPVPLPDQVEVLVVDSGGRRSVAGSAYGQRRRQCQAAAALIGPLRNATPADVAAIGDPVVRRRARHVVSENARVLAFADHLAARDLVAAGRLMTISHTSLRDDFEVSTPALDDVVTALVATPGVYGARLTGAGFGGCVVALARPGSVAGFVAGSVAGQVVRSADGATVGPAQ